MSKIKEEAVVKADDDKSAKQILSKPHMPHPGKLAGENNPPTRVMGEIDHLADEDSDGNGEDSQNEEDENPNIILA